MKPIALLLEYERLTNWRIVNSLTNQKQDSTLNRMPYTIRTSSAKNKAAVISEDIRPRYGGIKRAIGLPSLVGENIIFIIFARYSQYVWNIWIRTESYHTSYIIPSSISSVRYTLPDSIKDINKKKITKTKKKPKTKNQKPKKQTNMD